MLTGGEIIVQQESPGEEGWVGGYCWGEMHMDVYVCVQSQVKEDHL